MDSHGYNMIGEFKVDSVTTLPSHTSSDLRRLIYTEDTDKFYIGLTSDWQEIEFPSHADKHEIDGSDEIDGDKLDIDFTPDYYSPTTSPSEANNVDNLTAHLAGISNTFNTKASSAHSPLHVTSGSDEIDGDQLDIDWNPTYYTPSTLPSEVNDVNDLSAHLKGIDNLINEQTPTEHADTHIKDGSDEIDGDQLDIRYQPTNYTRSTSPTEVTSIRNLSAHLYGIDQELSETGESIKAWVNFTNTTINDSYNVSSVQFIDTGHYRINWDTDFANNSYCIVIMCQNYASGDYSTGYNWTTQYAYVEVNTGHQILGQANPCTVIAIGDQ